MIVALAVAISTPLVFAQDGDSDSLLLNLRDADIVDLAAVVSEQTGRNFVIDPRVRASVTVISARPVTPDELYETFLAILLVHGFVAIPTGDVTRIVPDAVGRQIGGDNIDPSAPRTADDIVTHVIELSHLNATQTLPAIRSLLPQSAVATAFGERLLIISDRAGNIDRVVEIVRRIDVRDDDDIELIPLQSAAATDVARVLETLIQGLQRGEGTQTVSIVADARSNTLMLSGGSAARLRLRAVIAHLDQSAANTGNTQVVRILHAEAEAIAAILQSVADGYAASSGREGGRDNRGTTIVPDAATNSIVITAAPELMRQLRSVVDQLDIRRAQVLIEAIIVEVTRERAADLGVQWLLDARSRFSAAGTVEFDRSGAGITGFGRAVADQDVTSVPDGLTVGVIRDRSGGTSYGALLTALAGDSNANILSMPHLMTMDNEEALIHVGQQVPFLTGQYSTSQQGGGVNPFQTIQRQDVGIRLLVTPKISDGDAIQLSIEQEVSNLTAPPPGAVDLVTNRREIRTRVIVDDGEIIVLGGMIDDSIIESQERVPILGRIPILGAAFRYQRSTASKRMLMVFLRPVIIRDADTSRDETMQMYQEMLQQQQEGNPGRPPLMPRERYPELPPIDGQSDGGPNNR